MLDGFQQRFFYEPLGRWLRWSQGADARLWLPVDRSDKRRLVLDIAFFSDESTRDGLTVEIDGEPVAPTLAYPRWRVPAGAGEGTEEAYHIAVSVELPPLVHSPQYTQVALKLPREVEGGGGAGAGRPAGGMIRRASRRGRRCSRPGAGARRRC